MSLNFSDFLYGDIYSFKIQLSGVFDQEKERKNKYVIV